MIRNQRRRRLGVLGAVTIVGVALSGLAFAGCGDGGSPTTASETTTHKAQAGGSGAISTREQRAARQRLARKLGVSSSRVKRLRSGHGLAATSVRPGEIVPGGPGPFFSSDVIAVTNGWQTSDHRSFTAVDAGVDPADRSVGELGIFRQDFVRAKQTQDVVDVRGAGAVRITKAPLGRSVVTSAQRRGNLEFVGDRGVSGTLHLKNDTVSITGGG